MKNRTMLLIVGVFLSSTLFAQTYQDTVFTVANDTLLGKVSLNKEKNTFYFTNDSLKEMIVSEKVVTSFVMYSKEFDYERKQFFSLLNNFYELEYGKNAHITIYARVSYKTIVEIGQKYFIQKKEYCLFKNGSPYFLNSDNRKQTLNFLIKDCPVVYRKFKSNSYAADDIFHVLNDYNNCSSIIK